MALFGSAGRGKGVLLARLNGVRSAGHGGRIGARPAANPKLMAARIPHTPARRARPPRASSQGRRPHRAARARAHRDAGRRGGRVARRHGARRGRLWVDGRRAAAVSSGGEASAPSHSRGGSSSQHSQSRRLARPRAGSDPAATLSPLCDPDPETEWYQYHWVYRCAVNKKNCRC